MKISQTYSSVFLVTILVFFIAATAYCQPNKKTPHSEEDKLIEKKIDLLLPRNASNNGLTNVE